MEQVWVYSDPLDDKPLKDRLDVLAGWERRNSVRGQCHIQVTMGRASRGLAFVEHSRGPVCETTYRSPNPRRSTWRSICCPNDSRIFLSRRPGIFHTNVTSTPRNRNALR